MRNSSVGHVGHGNLSWHRHPKAYVAHFETASGLQHVLSLVLRDALPRRYTVYLDAVSCSDALPTHEINTLVKAKRFAGEIAARRMQEAATSKSGDARR